MRRVTQRSGSVQSSGDLRDGLPARLGNTQVIRPPPQNCGKTPKTSPGALRSRLAYRLRKMQRPRVALCRTVRTTPAVQLIRRSSPDGSDRLVVYGVSTCGSVHSCPTCAAAILTRRAAEISEALTAHGRHRTALVTLTLRHHAGVPLRVLRTVLGRAWSEMWAGRQGQRVRAELGLVGHVRAAEQTWGQNGWHPHLHCLLFFEHPPPPDFEEQLTARWLQVVRQIFGRLWDAAALGTRLPESPELRMRIGRLIGARYTRDGKLADGCREFLRGLKSLGGLEGVMPSEEHAVRAEIVGTASAATYLAKLGCELTGILQKEGRNGSYTSWALAAEAARGEEWAQRLWREHADAMFGARQLTWSLGLRDQLGLTPERPDAELAAELEREPGDEDTPLVRIEGEDWDLVARRARQLFIAELHELFASGELESWRNLTGPPRRVKPSPDIAPSEQERQRRHEWFAGRGRDSWSRASAEVKRQDERRDRPWVPWSERKLQHEELLHYLRFELGISSAVPALGAPAGLSPPTFPLE